MKRVELVQIGLGYVGRATAQIVLEERKRWRERHGIDVRYHAVADTSGALVGEELLPQAIKLKEQGKKLADLGNDPLDFSELTMELEEQSGTELPEAEPGEITSVEQILSSEPEPGVTRIVVDLATHGGSYDLDLLGVRNGSFLVLSNKGPLAGSSAGYHRLISETPDRLWFEATVGAGMPIISTLKYLLESGDEVFEIQASPSGTLGFIMSAVESGRSFSEAVKEAVDLHYAEPDPRDDLSGLDVARKAIILARTMGREVEPEEIPYESLVPDGLEDVSQDEFMARLPEADEAFAERLNSVEKHHMLRYLAKIPKEGPIEVGLFDTPVESPFGPIDGPENVFDFHTRRYDDVSLTVTGPGAGPHRTASGVVYDILDIVHKSVADAEEG